MTVGLVGPAATSAVRASARLVAEPSAGGATRLSELRSDPPLVLRRTAPGEVHLVSVGGGPVAGDQLELRVRVLAGATLVVRQLAASIALPSPRDLGPSSLHLQVQVGSGARLIWAGEPTVAARGCDHLNDLDIELAEDATLVWRDEVVAGRSGEPPGRVRSRVTLRRADRLLLRSDTTVGGPDWSSPAVGGGSRVAGSLLLIGAPAGHVEDPSQPRGASLRLADDAVSVAVLADDHPTVRRYLLDAFRDP